MVESSRCLTTSKILPKCSRASAKYQIDRSKNEIPCRYPSSHQFQSFPFLTAIVSYRDWRAARTFFLFKASSKTERETSRLQVRVLLVWQRHLRGVVHLLLVLGQQLRVDLDLWGSEGRGGDEFLVFVSAVICRPRGGEGVPKRGCRQACEPATGTASRSCSWTWQRCRSTAGSSCGGR